MTTRLEDLLITAMRERAQAMADLADARTMITNLTESLYDAQLDAAVARELLAYHGLTPIEDAS